jgi:PIN/TRAM domain protein
MPTRDVIAGAIGLFIGLIIARLLGDSFSTIPIVGDYIPIVFSVVLGYLGVHIMVKKQQEITEAFDFIPRFLREMTRIREGRVPAPLPVQMRDGQTERQYKLLDTSVIIDGRIADICETGFLEGTLLIPVFVLEELQHIADSPDSLKRVRGRRGLDVLQKIRKESRMKVEITEADFEDITEVDSKLLQLAQEVGGKIITNDFNLNKVAQLRGVSVLNINALSNAVKPVAIPGDLMTVQIVRPGKEHGQGLAYLDDGTMIVVDGGFRCMNEVVSVEVTSALQTAAGRMIFAKLTR